MAMLVITWDLIGFQRMSSTANGLVFPHETQSIDGHLIEEDSLMQWYTQRDTLGNIVYY